MKLRRSRWLRIAIGGILLGLLTTLAFAWVIPSALIASGLAPPLPWLTDRMWIDDTHAGHYQVISQRFTAMTHFKHIIFAGPPNQLEFYKKDPPPSWAFTLLHSTRGDPPAHQREWWGVDTFASGWPCRAFRGGRYEPWPVGPAAAAPPTFSMVNGVLTSTPAAPPPPPALFTVSLYQFGGPTKDRFVVPLRPLPVGLALNILVFSLGWMAVWVVIALIRHARRAQRGHCPVCNYNLGGLAAGAPCPECGNAAAAGVA